MDKKKQPKHQPLSAAERQALLDNVSAEELAKVQAHQASTKGAFPVDLEWLLFAEFAKAYGWQAYLAVRRDEIKLDEMLTLIEANRILENKKLFEDMQSSFVGAISAQTKKPVSTFQKLTKDVIKKTKVSE